MRVTSLFLKVILVVLVIQKLECYHIIDLTPKMDFDIHKYMQNMKLESSDTKAKTKIPLHPLWKHTKRLVKHPFNLAELKICLQKSYIYLGKDEAALILGKYSLFEYPQEKAYKSNMFVSNETFCKEYKTEESQLQQNLDKLQQYDPVNAYSRDFAKSLYYFHQSEQLLNADAPIYILFLIQLAQYTENFKNIIDLDSTAYQNLNILLLNAATMRGSKLAQQLSLSEILQCKKLKQQYHNFSDILDEQMNSRLVDVMNNESDIELITFIEHTQEYIKIKQQQTNKENDSNSSLDEEQYIFISKGQQQQQKTSPVVPDDIINQIDELNNEDLDTLHQDMIELLKELNIEGLDIKKPTMQDMQDIKKQFMEMNMNTDSKEKDQKKNDNVEKPVDQKEVLDEDADTYQHLKKIYSNIIGSKLNSNTTEEENNRILNQVINKIEGVVSYSDHFIGLDQNGQCISCKDTLAIAAHVLANQNLDLGDDRSNNQIVDEDEEEEGDIQLSDKVIFANTEPTYQELVQQNHVTPTNQVEEILRMKASLGDVVAQVQLGGDYYMGNLDNNIQQNHQQALNYFQQAADQGQPQAMYNTGLLISNGQGAPKNGTKAKEYFEKAIELGEDHAYSGLGFLYSTGLDVPKNETKAALYFEQAILAGSDDSVVNLAQLYAKGFDSTPMNETKAFVLMRSVVHKNKRAQIYMALQQSMGKNISLSCETLLSYMIKKEEHDTTLDLFTEQAKKKFKVEKYDDALIFSLFASFLGYESAYQNSATIWTKLQKEQNHERDMKNMLMCSFNDFELCKLLFYYKDAIMHRNDSFVQVGHILYKGSQSFNPSHEYAFEFYNTSAYLPESLHSMSYLYELGHYVPKNITKANELNDKILEKVHSKEVNFNHFWPAILRKVYLFGLQYFDVLFG